MKTIKSIAAFVLALLAAPLACGGEPNKLTPEEIAAGWILLFDGESTFGWKGEGEAKVDGGVLHLDANATTQTTTTFGDFELSIETDVADDKATPQLNLMDAARPESSNLLALRPNEPRAKGWNTFIHRSQGGKVSLVGIVAKGGPVMLRSIKLLPLGTKPIFNGKDLIGWTEIPGRKSKFSVTPEGWLNVKDGNGDLQTEGQYDDFVLQMDIISNGKHLNSGIFFRCVPGEFWSGYESQIRNQWQGDDRTKPVDFGTGGIYNRQKTRRVVSSDGAWFTKTIVARGNHMAVWIDGIQVSDFTDNAQPANSARKGRKDGPGPISIQGHDPTTDLSFRNIRLAVLEK